MSGGGGEDKEDGALAIPENGVYVISSTGSARRRVGGRTRTEGGRKTERRSEMHIVPGGGRRCAT